MRHRWFQPKYLGGVVVVVLLAVLGVGSLWHDRPGPPHTVGQLPPKVLGLESTTQDYKLAISQRRFSATTNNAQRLSLRISLTNTGQQTLQIAPGLQMTVLTARGAHLPVTARYLQPDQIIGGPLPSGKTMLQDVDFDVPNGEQPVSLHFQLDAAAPITEVSLL